VRYPSNRLASCAFPPLYERVAAKVRDISQTGIGLLVHRVLEPGTSVVIRLKSAIRRLPVELGARVVHCTPRSEGDWLLGCALDHKLLPQELHALL
jgi:hypothetical protein